MTRRPRIRLRHSFVGIFSILGGMVRVRSIPRSHQSEATLVCGCSEPLNELAASESLVTIGVNDVGRRLQRDYPVHRRTVPPGRDLAD
jgi:hypothetical protein